MKIFPEGRSRALSAAALTLAAACGAMAAGAVADLVSFFRFSSASVFPLALARAVMPLERPPLAELAANYPGVLFAVWAMLWLAGCVLAAGVLRRREWARRGAAAMLYLVSAAAALALLFPALVIPRPIVIGGADAAPEFNSAVRAAVFYLRFACVTGGGVALWWALLLDRGPLKAEFIKD